MSEVLKNLSINSQRCSSKPLNTSWRKGDTSATFPKHEICILHVYIYIKQWMTYTKYHYSTPLPHDKQKYNYDPSKKLKRKSNELDI